jgi:hypothetical protein
VRVAAWETIRVDEAREPSQATTSRLHSHGCESHSPTEDAEDAYQRGLEILLRKAPTTRECELVPWLKTVVIRTFDSPLLLLCMESGSRYGSGR